MERSLRNKLFATVLLALLAVFALTLLPKASEAYADSSATQVASGTCGGCDWAIELDSSNNGVLTIKPTTGDSGQLASCSSASQWPWHKYQDQITTVKIEPGVYEGTSTAYMFFDFKKLITVSIPEGFGSHATNMSYMFYGCYKYNPISPYPSGFGSKATDMGAMFYACYKFNPQAAFPDGFGSKATEMGDMFGFCESFNPQTAFPAGFGSNATGMRTMFVYCESFNLATAFPEGFGSKVTRMDSLFEYCENLVAIDLSSMDTRKVTSGTNVFGGCTNLRMVKLGENWTFNGADASRNSGMNFPDAPTANLTTGKWKCINGANEGKVYAASKIPDGAGTYKWETTYTIKNKDTLEEIWQDYKKHHPNSDISIEFFASSHSVDDADVALIKKRSGNDNLFCFDARITVTIDGKHESVATTRVPLVVSYPFDCSNIDQLSVYRVHDGVVEELPLSAALIAGEYDDYVTYDGATNTITIASSKYSTYAFAYKESVPATDDSSSAAIALSLAAMLCASACLIAAHRRKA